MRTVTVEFEVAIPTLPDGREPTEAEIREWLRYEFKDNGQMSLKNPLCDTEAEPVRGTFHLS